MSRQLFSSSTSGLQLFNDLKTKGLSVAQANQLLKAIEGQPASKLDLRQQLSALQAELQQEIRRSRSQLTQEIRNSRSQVTQEINTLKAEVTTAIWRAAGALIVGTAVIGGYELMHAKAN